MKKLLFLLLILSFSSSFAQRNKLVPLDLSLVFPIKDNKICYTEVVQVADSTSKNILFLRANKTIVEIFQSGKDVTQIDDKDNGIIIAKGFYAKGHSNYLTNPQIWFTVKIEVKDNRYKYTINDLNYKFDVYFAGAHNSYNGSFEEWLKPNELRKQKVVDASLDWLREIDAYFKQTIKTIKTQMQQKEDNW